MISIDNYDFKGKRAIIRVDFNVPLNEKGEVTDDTRIRAAIPTIKKVLAEGGSVILMSHMGRPKKNPDPKYSLEQIVPAVEKNLGTKVEFAGDCIGEKAAEMAKNLKPGQVMLLENLRFYAEEEGKPRGLAEDASKEEKDAAKKALKEGPQKEFVKKLASLADCYINDAFGTAHRKHASTYLIAKQFPNDKMFGYLMEKEVKAISSLMEAPAHPFCAIVGGSKVSSKIGVIKALIEKVDSIIIGGGMTYTFGRRQEGPERGSAEGVRQETRFAGRLLYQRRVRHGPPQARFDLPDRQTVPQRQDVRLPDGERGEGHLLADGGPGPSVLRHRGRIEGFVEDRRDQGADREGRFDHHRRRHDLHLRGCAGR